MTNANRIYDGRRITTPAERLAFYRSTAEGYDYTGRKYDGWQDVAKGRKSMRPFRPTYSGYNPEVEGRCFGSYHCRWVEDVSKHLRFVGYADEITSAVEHTGWFTDNFQDETVRGAVWQLPTRNHELQFVYGYVDPWNDDSAFISFEIVTQDLSDMPDLMSYYGNEPKDWEACRSAALYADQMAQLMAEESRENDAKFQAEQQIETLHEQAKDAIEAFHDLKPSAREKQDSVVCTLIHKELMSMRETVSESIRRIKELKDDPWSAVPRY